ncbi:hypothetical protein Mgra_00007525 [Meloidogyne graminicola]|uniref:Uncharacterized protein n=1 Tax=Meloidogyne graminicola TaxID=189291 RepID=A0A8S9ZIG7_9BILA|nr:hypothetical protein Mgra_00007525 [Meloidogyne graminicola]
MEQQIFLIKEKKIKKIFSEIKIIFTDEKLRQSFCESPIENEENNKEFNEKEINKNSENIDFLIKLEFYAQKLSEEIAEEAVNDIKEIVFIRKNPRAIYFDDQFKENLLKEFEEEEQQQDEEEKNKKINNKINCKENNFNVEHLNNNNKERRNTFTNINSIAMLSSKFLGRKMSLAFLETSNNQPKIIKRKTSSDTTQQKFKFMEGLFRKSLININQQPLLNNSMDEENIITIPEEALINLNEEERKHIFNVMAESRQRLQQQTNYLNNKQLINKSFSFSLTNYELFNLSQQDNNKEEIENNNKILIGEEEQLINELNKNKLNNIKLIEKEEENNINLIKEINEVKELNEEEEEKIKENIIKKESSPFCPEFWLKNNQTEQISFTNIESSRSSSGIGDSEGESGVGILDNIFNGESFNQFISYQSTSKSLPPPRPPPPTTIINTNYLISSSNNLNKNKNEEKESSNVLNEICWFKQELDKMNVALMSVDDNLLIEEEEKKINNKIKILQKKILIII